MLRSCASSSKEHQMAFAITSDGHGFILHGELDMANEQALAAAFEAVLDPAHP